MRSALVSIITPMYKGAKFVGETIESVLAQDYTDWEMIIVDDCSPDNGAGIAVVQSYAQNDSRIRLIASKENRGSSGSRNIAIQEAKGKYIAFLDSDDLWHPSFLSQQVSFLNNNEASIVFSSYRRIDENTKEEILRPFIVPERVNYKSLLKTCPIFPSTAIYDVDKCGKYYFNESLGSMRDDYVYWLQMLKNIDYAYGNKAVLVDYRIRKDSVTASKKKVIKPQWNVLRKVEKVSFIKSLYYIVCWGVISVIKYAK